MNKIACISAFVAVALLSCKSRQMNQNKEIPFPAFSSEGHRGARGLMPENTIIAMKKAIDLGITTLEMDTHITGDGEVVVTHDDYLSPGFMLSPEGKDIPSKTYNVYKMNYAELKKFDLGSKVHAGFPEQKKIKTYIPRLADLIDSVQSYIKINKKKQMFYNIETKCDAKGDGVTNPDPETFVKLLMDVIEKKKISSYVVIQSFDKRTLQVLNKKYPAIKTSFLINNKKSFEANMKDLGFKPFILSPEYKLVTPDLVKKCHDSGVKVVPWTANTAEDIARLRKLNVDGIISDYPNLLVP
jgi:glycerophosphoryl diester phosphodiesterase